MIGHVDAYRDPYHACWPISTQSTHRPHSHAPLAPGTATVCARICIASQTADSSVGSAWINDNLSQHACMHGPCTASCKTANTNSLLTQFQAARVSVFLAPTLPAKVMLRHTPRPANHITRYKHQDHTGLHSRHCWNAWLRTSKAKQSKTFTSADKAR